MATPVRTVLDPNADASSVRTIIFKMDQHLVTCGHAGEPSPVEAEEYLTEFQAFKIKFFPFVCIPSTMSSKQLRQERPFLWLCIMVAGSKSTSQHQVLDSKVRQIVAQEMVVRSEKNTDLLLGLLSFTGWYTSCQCQMPKFRDQRWD